MRGTPSGLAAAFVYAVYGRLLMKRPQVNRRAFLTLGASAPLALTACNNGVSTIFPPAVPVYKPAPAPATLAAGTQVADLRFGFAPTPPVFPGYDPAGDAKALILAGTPSPAQIPIPGTQSTGSYKTNQRYLVKVPNAWNGKLVVLGTPATRSEFANDAIWGDFFLALGYAYACSNKGIPYNAAVETVNTTTSPTGSYPIPFNLGGFEALGFTYKMGVLNPITPINTWNDDFALLTVSAKLYLATNFGKAPTKTYAVGISNGGAQVRSLLEQHGDLVDGGVDWEGVYWSPTLSILNYLPKFVQAMPAYVASNFTDPVSAAAIVAAGFPADRTQAVAAHPSLWFEFYANQASFYNDLSTFVYSLLIDPTVSSSIAAPGCIPNATDPARQPGNCTGATGMAVPQNRQTYAPSSAAQANIASFAHTGKIYKKPLVSIAGSADMLIPPATNAIPYLNAVIANGSGSNYWQYLVNGGTHVDPFSAFGYGLQPNLQFAWAAFNQLVSIVEKGYNPPGAGTQQAVSTPSQIVSI